MVDVFQPSFAGGEIAPSLYGRVDLDRYQRGLKTCLNAYIRPQGGVSNRPGFEFVGRTRGDAQARLIPFEFSTTQTYILEFTDLRMRVIKDAGHVLEASKAISGVTQAAPAVVTATAHGFSNGDEVYITGVGGMTALNGKRFLVASVTTNTFELQSVDGIGINSTAYAAYTSGGTVARVFTLVTPYALANLATLKFSQTADVMTLTHPAFAVRELSRSAHAAWSLTTVPFSPLLTAPTGLSAAASSTSSPTLTYKYKVTALDADLAEESLPSAEDTVTSTDLRRPLQNYNDPRPNVTLTWTAVAGAGRYKIYKDNSGGVYGFIGYAEAAGSPTFVDDNIAPDTNDTPPGDRDPFDSTDNYPGVVEFFQQRRVFAATNNEPQTIWTSQIGNLANMNYSLPPKADDAITFTIAARQVQQIRHLVALDTLVVLTSGAEWILNTANNEPLTPNNLSLVPHSYYGASDVRPLVIGSDVLFVQDGNSKVRNLRYAFVEDRFGGTDISVVAEHMLRGKTVVDWAYTELPNAIVWAVLSDGTIAGFTYHPEQDVVAWHRHTTDGTFESVASIREVGEDALYAVVRRTIAGVQRRYVERLHTRQFIDATDAFFVDSGLSYTGAATTTLTGLGHLEGKTVRILGNGAVLPDAVVAAGAITLPVPVTKAHVGLGYVADIELLPIGVAQGGSRTQRKNIQSIAAVLEDKRGGWFGPNATSLRERKRSAAEYADPSQLFTGTIEQNVRASPGRDATLLIRQSDPLPLTVLAATPSVDFEDGGG